MDIDLKEMEFLIDWVDEPDPSDKQIDDLSDFLWENKDELFRLSKLGQESENSGK